MRINSPFSTSWQRGKSHETSLRASVRVISVTTPTAGDRRSHPTSVSTTRTERRRFWPTPAIRQVGHAILMVTTSSPLVFRIRHIWCVPPAKLARNLHVHYGENTKTVSPVAGVGRSVERLVIPCVVGVVSQARIRASAYFCVRPCLDAKIFWILLL